MSPALAGQELFAFLTVYPALCACSVIGATFERVSKPQPLPGAVAG
jgi:hypothetical protein